MNAAAEATGFNFPMTIAMAQLVISSIYALFLWIAPDARTFPSISPNDMTAMLPVGICMAGAHAASVFAMGAGAVSFAQIVKASEPVFAAVLGVFVYKKHISQAKWLCLIPVIGGVCLASVKELDFAWSALAAGLVANLFAAFRSNENKRLMDTPGLSERIGVVGNQFALSTLVATVALLPLYLVTEFSRLSEFIECFKTTDAVRSNVLSSGIYWYLYNELSTLTIKKTSATTQSVANTAKRVIVIVGTAMVLGESLDPMKMLGCSIGIGGVLLYSLMK